MDYKEMIEKAKREGRANEDAMWRSVGEVCKLLKLVKDNDPDMYNNFMRKSHELYYGNHYDAEFASMDTANLFYTDRDGIERNGPHWTINETNTATAGMSFPKGTTQEDIWVALNACYADFCRKFDDSQIIDIAYLFFFNDEDWKDDGKIWSYMSIDR